MMKARHEIDIVLVRAVHVYLQSAACTKEEKRILNKSVRAYVTACSLSRGPCDKRAIFWSTRARKIRSYLNNFLRSWNLTPQGIFDKWGE